MDARRLGMGVGLPQAFLEAAAPGYLTDAEWDALGEDWLRTGPGLHRQATQGRPRPTDPHPPPPGPGHRRPRPRGPARRHVGRRQPGRCTGSRTTWTSTAEQHRASQIPPAEFWSAAAAHASPGDQAALGNAAHARGLYRAAAQLHKNAAASR